jgi:hypothetical protein
MFIALYFYGPRSSGSAMCLVSYIPLLTERDNSVPKGYRHLAPMEQEPRTTEKQFSAKARCRLNEALRCS